MDKGQIIKISKIKARMIAINKTALNKNYIFKKMWLIYERTVSILKKRRMQVNN